MITEKITCDICHAERGIDNHWLLAQSFKSPQGLDCASFSVWASNYTDAYFAHICSATCAAKLITQVLLTNGAKNESPNLSTS